MSAVEGFVHLYHVWGILGAITAALFGLEAWRGWRVSGGTFRSAPSEWLYALRFSFREALFDCARLALWAGKSATGVPFVWENAEWQSRSYPRRQIILIGITLGGLSRMMTALYWSERNRDWMAHVDISVIFAASIVIFPAIIGDLYHQMTAWPNKHHRARLLGLACFAWVFAGMMGV